MESTVTVSSKNKNKTQPILCTGGHAAAARRPDEAQTVQTGTAALDGRQRSGPAVVGRRCLASTTKTQIFGHFPTVVNGPLGAPFSFFLLYF